MVVTLAVDVTELVVMQILRPDLDVQARIGTRVYTEIPNPATYPLVVARRLGGSSSGDNSPPDRIWGDAARVQYDTWSLPRPQGTKKDTWRIAETIRAVLIAAPTRDFTGAVVTRVEDSIGPFEQNDPDSDGYHFIGEVVVHVHPKAS